LCSGGEVEEEEEEGKNRLDMCERKLWCIEYRCVARTGKGWCEEEEGKGRGGVGEEEVKSRSRAGLRRAGAEQEQVETPQDCRKTGWTQKKRGLATQKKRGLATQKKRGLAACNSRGSTQLPREHTTPQ